MRGYGLAISTGIATWVLLVLGGIVNPTGSSLACPDWVFLPTCHGQVLPDSWADGVLVEHGHRLWASLVGLLTLALAIVLWRQEGLSPTTRRLAVGAVFLVAAQGSLGGLTVLLGLHPAVSTGHLLLANLFFCLVVILAARVRAEVLPPDTPSPRIDRRLVGVLAGLILLQVVLGGAVRHLGAGPACGFDVMSCGEGGLWPSGGSVLFERRLHMLHRFAGLALAAAVLVGCHGFRGRALASGRARLAGISRMPMVLVGLQVLLGVATVMGFESSRHLIRVPVVALHTAVGGLLLASLVVCFLGAGPLFSTPAGQDP